jgi:hypothetical protein
VKIGTAPAKAMTSINKDIVAGKTVADVESLPFKSFDGMSAEAFLTKPAKLAAGSKHPLILMIHGGPHGQQGPAFNAKAQVYAARGYATLMVNYRGSTGYGQKFADAIFNDQDGGEGKDVLAGVDAALAKYSWLDANRLGIEGGSYGGQLTDWLITQTTRFKAAVPAAGIANLVSFNYMSYYHDYLQVEFGVLPHQQWKPNDKAAPRRLADFLQNAAIPALNRLGHTPIGVFEVLFGLPTPTVFVMTPFSSVDKLLALETSLDKDEEFSRAGASYVDATATDPAYVRQEVSLLTAFPKFPRIEVPAAAAAKGPRIFELRTYESPSERAHRAKVKMFEELGEIEIFRKCGLTPVFFSRTLAGPRMPSLVYMLVYENMAAHDKGWGAFRDNPDWKKLSTTPGYTDPEIISNITSVLLRPAAYSQI